MAEEHLGSRLKNARIERGLSLRSLAASIGVSPSLLSQIENGKTNPSVDTLYMLVQQLDTSVDEMLGHQRTGGKTGRPAQEGAGTAPRLDGKLIHQTVEDTPVLEMENGVVWERLAVLPGLDVEALRVTYQPGGSSSVEGRLMRHLGFEHIVMLSGQLSVQHEFDTYTLKAGDSMAFDSRRPHLFVNNSDEPATGLWYIFGRHAEGPVSANEQPRSTGKGRKLTSGLDVLKNFESSAS